MALSAASVCCLPPILYRLLPGVDAVAARALFRLRRARRRLCPGRGRGGHGPEAVEPGAGRWRPGARAYPGNRREFRRAHDRLFATQPVAQSALLRSVYARAACLPKSLDFMEAHGTGTPAGDPIELSAIGEALGRKRASPLRIGSVKTNVGISRRHREWPG